MLHATICGLSILCQATLQNPYTPEEETPIAYFDVVPQQYVTGVFDMGVLAYQL